MDSLTMPELPGADSRQSRLDCYTPATRDALALAGLALFDAINRGHIVVNPKLPRELAASAVDLVEAGYGLQDAIAGSDYRINAALASFLAAAESEARHG